MTQKEWRLFTYSISGLHVMVDVRLPNWMVGVITQGYFTLLMVTGVKLVRLVLAVSDDPSLHTQSAALWCFLCWTSSSTHSLTAFYFLNFSYSPASAFAPFVDKTPLFSAIYRLISRVFCSRHILPSACLPHDTQRGVVLILPLQTALWFQILCAVPITAPNCFLWTPKLCLFFD